MDGFGGYTGSSEAPGQLIGCVFHLCKYQQGFDGLVVEQFDEKGLLLMLIHEVNGLLDDLNR